ncbi:hypothetical protein HPP92_000961 [Vanilla planifolia]|uniref:Uncharacterized protein n=1 Tax=Vanilla planifolia TaxID=51239 RepID=A0A835VGL7_VANPL|nr:hypothetical protein HPP92_000961 [Vanilla planifolia]
MKKGCDSYYYPPLDPIEVVLVRAPEIDPIEDHATLDPNPYLTLLCRSSSDGRQLSQFCLKKTLGPLSLPRRRRIPKIYVVEFYFNQICGNFYEFFSFGAAFAELFDDGDMVKRRKPHSALHLLVTKKFGITLFLQPISGYWIWNQDLGISSFSISLEKLVRIRVLYLLCFFQFMKA